MKHRSWSAWWAGLAWAGLLGLIYEYHKLEPQAELLWSEMKRWDNWYVLVNFDHFVRIPQYREASDRYWNFRTDAWATEVVPLGLCILATYAYIVTRRRAKIAVPPQACSQPPNSSYRDPLPGLIAQAAESARQTGREKIAKQLEKMQNKL